MMNSSNIKVSILFPSYNGEDVIYDNLKSIQLLENSNNIEIIVVDNNSADSTNEIVRSFKNNINIKHIRLKKNIGFAKACNIAVKKAKGEFIFITNQDVSFPKNFFKILLDLYNRIKNDNEIIISTAIVFPGRYINYFGAKIHFLGFSYTPNMYMKISEQKVTFKTLKASGCSMFMKKNIYEELNGFDSFFFMYHEDTDFSLRAIRNNLIIYTTNETVLHHQKIHMSLNDFTYYNIEKNRYVVLYKNLKSIKSILPFLIISEIILMFQAFLTKKIKLRLKIYKYLIQNFKIIRTLRSNDFNKDVRRLSKNNLDTNLNPIILGGRILINVKIFRIFLKIINLIF